MDQNPIKKLPCNSFEIYTEEDAKTKPTTEKVPRYLDLDNLARIDATTECLERQPARQLLKLNGKQVEEGIRAWHDPLNEAKRLQLEEQLKIDMLAWLNEQKQYLEIIKTDIDKKIQKYKFDQLARKILYSASRTILNKHVKKSKAYLKHSQLTH